MRILNEHDTIKHLIRNKRSIARYGDGELKLCFDRAAVSQAPNPEIKKALRGILKGRNKRCLVGIPRVHERETWRTQKKKKFWKKYITPAFMNLYDPLKLYGSAFVTRPDACPEIDNGAYFDLVKQLWIGKRVILVQGEYQRFNKSKTLLDCSKTLHTICEPKRDAFSVMPDMIAYLKDNWDKETVIVLSLGPTATVMAYELSKLNIQALDLGHMGQFYSNCHPKSARYDGEPYELS